MAKGVPTRQGYRFLVVGRGTYSRKAREHRGAIKTNRVRTKVYVLRRSRELPRMRHFCNYLFSTKKRHPIGVSLFGGGKRHILAQGARASRHEKTNRVRAKVYVLRRSRELPRMRHFCNYLFSTKKRHPKGYRFLVVGRGTYSRKTREHRGAIKTNRVRAKV